MIGQGGGSIVNVASTAGLGGGAAGAAYTVSKHALIGLTRSTAFVYALDGVRCNAIAAGAVKTNIMQSVDIAKMDPKGSARFGTWYAAIPAQLEAIDIAQLALYLASDESQGVNGAIIPADAGGAPLRVRPQAGTFQRRARRGLTNVKNPNHGSRVS